MSHLAFMNIAYWMDMSDSFRESWKRSNGLEFLVMAQAEKRYSIITWDRIPTASMTSVSVSWDRNCTNSSTDGLYS